MNAGAKSKIQLKKLHDINILGSEFRGDKTRITKQSRDAKDELARYYWCTSVDKIWFGAGVPGIFCSFLCAITTNSEGIDSFLWVVNGDLPTAYFVTDSAPEGYSALEVYIGLMNDWVVSARTGGDMQLCYPVGVAPNTEHVRMLVGRLNLIKSYLLEETDTPNAVKRRMKNFEIG
jgi:hypothetical protein